MLIGDRRRPSNALLIVSGVLLAALNLALITFYLLYQVADGWAVNRSEDHRGFDPSYLLPNDTLLWLVAGATVALLAAVDVTAILVGARLLSNERVNSAR